MADEEEFPVDDNYGLIDQPEQADVVLDGVVTTGDEDGPVDESNPEPPMVEPVTPVDSWAEVDPDYEELLDEDAEVEDAPDEDIPSGAPDTSGDDATPFEGVAWAFYEIEGRSFDRDGAWQLLAREEFTGALDARIEGLPAGERWEFRVRLVDHDGVASAWSETTLDQLPVDETPPPAPTAPLWDQNNGFLTYGWDGNLVAPTPEDMSHTLAYVRQLHPAGNPQGPAGDPRLLARFMQEGYQSTGSLVADVPHELWLVAVDTTGNGSQWSEVVEFTPSEPVDAQRIRDELDTLDARVGEGFEESLTEAIAGADHRIERLAVGELFVENAIKAPSIDVQDLAANVGRMNELWAGFAGISEAQIITLLGDTATFKTINAPLLQSHTQADRGWKHRPDGTSVWHDPEGNVSAELNGARNFLRGELEAQVNDGASVVLSSGDVSYSTLVYNHNTRTMARGSGATTGGFLRFRRTGVSDLRSPGITYARTGNRAGDLIITPETSTGTTNDRSVYVPGRFEAEDAVAQRLTAARLEATGMIGVYSTVNFASGYSSGSGTGPVHYIQFGDWVLLSGVIERGGSRDSWSGQMATVPPPAVTQRIPSLIFNATGIRIPVIISIGTDGWLNVYGGGTVTTGISLPLNGIVYRVGSQTS